MMYQVQRQVGELERLGNWYQRKGRIGVDEKKGKEDQGVSSRNRSLCRQERRCRSSRKQGKISLTSK